MGAILKLELDIIYPNTKIKVYVDIDSRESIPKHLRTILLKVLLKLPAFFPKNF